MIEPFVYLLMTRHNRLCATAPVQAYWFGARHL
jgi:hypothetical protein